MGKTKIDWADYVWNPVTGCSPVGPACDHCYAKRMAKRLAGRCGYPPGDGFTVTLHPERLDDPLLWRKPSLIFTVSMGDLFHEDVRAGWFVQVMRVVRMSRKHTFVVLTKRPHRMAMAIDAYLSAYPLLDNLWLGVSVWDQESADHNIPILMETPAAKRVVSYEPALSPVDWYPFLGWPLGSKTPAIDWLVAGAETGPGARPANLDWFREAADAAKLMDIAFWLKQVDSKRNRTLDGRTWDEKPA